MKTNRILFDIKYRPQIESGEYKVETRDGRSARILAWDIPGDYPIAVAYGTDGDEKSWCVERFTENGISMEEYYDDLFLVPTVMSEDEHFLDDFKCDHLHRKRVIPTLSGQERRDFDDEFNTLYQTLDFGTFEQCMRKPLKELCMNFVYFGSRLGRDYFKDKGKSEDVETKLTEFEDERIRKDIRLVIESAATRYFKETGKMPEYYDRIVAYLEKQKDSDKAQLAVELIDKYIDENTANAHDMKDSNPDKKYYSGVDDTLSNIAGILIEVYSEGKQKQQNPILEVFGFKVGDTVRLKDGDGRKHIIKSFEKIEGIHGPDFYHVVFEDSAASDHIIPNKDYPNGYYTHMEKLEEEQKSDNGIDYDISLTTNDEQSSLKAVGNVYDNMHNAMKQQSAEWSDEYREEDLRTRFAFYTYKNEEDDGVLYLSNVFVEETSRNKGFGTKILAAAEKVAETLGAVTICLKVKQDSPANAWYRKHGYGYVAVEGEYDWLEKHLEYLKPAKQEWSKEDDALLKEIVSFFKDGTVKLQHDLDLYAGFLENKFKSLRPQPHWKPSEEQMEELEQVINGKALFRKDFIENLYNDLKKL